MEARYFRQSSDFEDQEPVPNYEEEEKDIETAPGQDFKVQFIGSVSDLECTKLSSRFSLKAALAAESKIKSPLHKSGKEARKKKTKKYREDVLKAKKVTSLEQLSKIVSHLLNILSCFNVFLFVS